MLWSSDTCQNKVSTDDVIVGSSLELIKLKCFLKLTADQVLVWIELWTRVKLTCCKQDRVVWKQIYLTLTKDQLNNQFFLYTGTNMYFDIIQTQNRRPKHTLDTSL